MFGRKKIMESLDRAEQSHREIRQDIRNVQQGLGAVRKQLLDLMDETMDAVRRKREAPNGN